MTYWLPSMWIRLLGTGSLTLSYGRDLRDLEVRVVIFEEAQKEKAVPLRHTVE